MLPLSFGIGRRDFWCLIGDLHCRFIKSGPPLCSGQPFPPAGTLAHLSCCHASHTRTRWPERKEPGAYRGIGFDLPSHSTTGVQGMRGGCGESLGAGPAAVLNLAGTCRRPPRCKTHEASRNNHLSDELYRHTCKNQNPAVNPATSTPNQQLKVHCSYTLVQKSRLV